jgi:hypothetical protein
MGSVAINKSVEPVRNQVFGNQVFDAAHIAMIRFFFANYPQVFRFI